MSDHRPFTNGNEVIAAQAKRIDDLNEQLRAAKAEIERLRMILLLDGRFADANKEIERLQFALREAREWLAVYCEEKAYDPIKAIIDAVLSQEPRP